METNTNKEQVRYMSPSLTAQTPGLDATAEARDFAMRQVTWVRENRALLFSVVGGLAAIGLGAYLVLRSRRPTRMELLRGKGEDILDWLRELPSKVK
jgi:hypothetical protein